MFNLPLHPLRSFLLLDLLPSPTSDPLFALVLIFIPPAKAMSAQILKRQLPPSHHLLPALLPVLPPSLLLPSRRNDLCL